MILTAREWESGSTIPPEVILVIKEFIDVLPKDLSNKLPPMRGIQHAIDLVLRTSLPNLSHYRMNPTEHAELKRQVDELVRKSLETMSLLCGPRLVDTKKEKMDLGAYAWITVQLIK